MTESYGEIHLSSCHHSSSFGLSPPSPSGDDVIYEQPLTMQCTTVGYCRVSHWFEEHIRRILHCNADGGHTTVCMYMWLISYTRMYMYMWLIEGNPTYHALEGHLWSYQKMASWQEAPVDVGALRNVQAVLLCFASHVYCTSLAEPMFKDQVGVTRPWRRPKLRISQILTLYWYQVVFGQLWA